MDKRFLAILASLAIIFVGIFVVSQHSSNKSSGTANSAQPTSHVTGAGQKNVTLIEYGDYECPVCEAYYQPLKQVVGKYAADIHFQFRNLPLVQLHKNAFAAARAAEAAGLQNKYWQMHDALYEQSNWVNWRAANNPQTFFETYAQQIGLNLEQLRQDFTSSKVNEAINADIAEFNKTGKSQGTPSFFLDGQYIDNSQVADSSGPSFAKFQQLIDAEIAKKNPHN